ncbi:unnamed protein product [Rhizoctonia solani]|uniref:Laminin domain protein n=1 Tax=Rhizoctonia solani TaxID=456999 RepID=A0A8H2XVI9_9AGAM|nr:unnamed protein product [Rhizoctonia solani]
MTDHSGWYPPSQVCYPPVLPTYLKNVYDLQPIVGLPSNDEVVGIHTIIQAATKVSSVPGMHDSDLFMKLADHLFSAQMLVYRSKYTNLLFPTDVTYTPPVLPAHVPVNLEPVSCAPSDEEVTKVQDAIRTYQKYSEIPSMFEPRVSAELSQHFFDIQMARYMSRAAQRQPIIVPQEITQPRNSTGITTDIGNDHASNDGTGAGVIESHQLQNTVIRDVLERSNQLAERSNQLIERSNEIAERTNQLMDRPDQPVEQSSRSTGQPSPDNRPGRFNEPLGRLNQYLERSNQLAEEFKAPVEQIGDALKTINKVLVEIQHAIVRSCKGNSTDAIRSLVNEEGDLPTESTWLWFLSDNDNKLDLRVGQEISSWFITDDQIVYYLQFYGIEGDFFADEEKTTLLVGKKNEARKKLGRYLTSALAW